MTRRQIISWGPLIVLAVLSVLLSPILVKLFLGGGGANWSRVSSFGQAYGPASAILSALALLTIAFSVLVQVRNLRVSTTQALRNQRFELAKIALSDPSLFAPLWGSLDQGRTEDQIRQLYFLAMDISYAHAGFILGVFSEETLEFEFLRPLFETEIGRKWWEDSFVQGGFSVQRNSKDRKFYSIINRVYEEEIAKGLPAITGVRLPVAVNPNPKARASNIVRRVALFGGLNCAVSLGVRIGLEARRRQL